ncbi:unnamed protein product [Prorocentrum cordatum]|uniref:Endoplasmic reticulum transmembrane protein n=1 Tax=Prorocentrum cordatum TaxID=2364126 RepID=A0ABN9WSL9_9DINO|nr:unnamed protein product [Polarella glacialis]
MASFMFTRILMIVMCTVLLDMYVMNLLRVLILMETQGALANLMKAQSEADQVRKDQNEMFVQSKADLEQAPPPSLQ